MVARGVTGKAGSMGHGALEQWLAIRAGWLVPLVAVLGVTAVALATARLVPGDAWYGLPGDHHIYRWMAENGPTEFHIAPWGWRPLVPALASTFPQGVTFGFQAITAVSLAGTAAIMYVIARGFQFSRVESLAGVAFFLGLGHAVKFNLYDFWLPDATSFLFVALAVVLIQRKADLALALCLAVGVLAKESVLLVIVLHYALQVRRPFDRAALARSALVALPSVAVLVAVRFGINSLNGDAEYLRSFPHAIWLNAKRLPSYSFWAVFSDTVAARADAVFVSATKALSAFGLPLSLLAVVGAAVRRSLAVRLAPYLVLVFMQLLLAGDTQRLVVLGFPAVIVLALAGGVSLCRWARLGTGWLLALSLSLVLLAILSGPHEWQPEPLVQLAAVTTLLAVCWYRAATGPGNSDTPPGPYPTSGTPQSASSSSERTVKNQSR